MSVNEKMTAIADALRATMDGWLDDYKFNLDDMAEFIGYFKGYIANAMAAATAKGGVNESPDLPDMITLPDVITSIPTGSGGSSNPVLQAKSVTPSETAQTVTPDSGYDGLSRVSVGAISNTYVGSGVTRKNAATITPGTTDQTIAAGQYLSGAQTIKGDANLKAANIKSGVSIFGVTGTASSGTTVQRKAGSFTTDNTGAATVNCGFQPDVLLITGLYNRDGSYNYEYHAACVFPEQKQSSYWLSMAANTSTYQDGIEFYPERTSSGFNIEVWENNVVLGDWYGVADVTFSYVAIKYTA